MRRFIILSGMVIALICAAKDGLLRFDAMEWTGGYHLIELESGQAMADDFNSKLNSRTIMMDMYLLDKELNIFGEYNLKHGPGIGGSFSVGRWDTPDSLVDRYQERMAVGFGEFRVGYEALLYRILGKWTISAGTGLGVGITPLFVDDYNGENDGDIYFNVFTRPQVDVTYQLGNTLLMIGAGYHLPFAGQDGLFWYNNPEGIRREFVLKPSELAGIFFKLGVTFGNLRPDPAQLQILPRNSDQ